MIPQKGVQALKEVQLLHVATLVGFSCGMKSPASITVGRPLWPYKPASARCHTMYTLKKLGKLSFISGRLQTCRLYELQL